MASPLDFGFLSILTPVLVWALVFLLFYAVLAKFDVFGSDKNLHLLIAAIAALLLVFIADLQDLLSLFIPYFILFFILIIFILIGVMLFGVSQGDITSYAKKNAAVIVGVIIILVVIFAGSVAEIFPEFIGAPAAGADDPTSDVRRIVFHPRVLGVVFIFLVLYFIVRTVGFKRN